MRPLLALFTATLLGAILTACGSASKVAGSTAPASTATGSTGAAAQLTTAAAASAGGYVKEDGDKDDDDGAHPSEAGQDDGSLFASYPGSVSPTESRAIATLVRHYYEASLTGNGAQACALLSAGLARGLAADLAQPTQDARDTCAAAISPLLDQQRQHLTEEDPATMVVVGVHLNGNLALVVLGFKRAPEGAILAEREGAVWKMDALFDTVMT
jgi:hypothetical protein